MIAPLQSGHEHQPKFIAASTIATTSKEAWKTNARRWKFLLLLLPGFYTASIDLTVVATAQPFIASHFRRYSYQALLVYILIIEQKL